MRHLFVRQTSAGAKMGLGLVGAAVGAATAYYLYATKDGAKKRAQIAKFAKSMQGKAEDKFEEVKEDIKKKLA